MVKEIQSLREKDTQDMFGLVLEKKFSKNLLEEQKELNKIKNSSSTGRRILHGSSAKPHSLLSIKIPCRNNQNQTQYIYII